MAKNSEMLQHRVVVQHMAYFTQTLQRLLQLLQQRIFTVHKNIPLNMYQSHALCLTN